jgi:hypothetical protein
MTERGIGTKEERLAVDDEPTRSPAFTETMQIGIVVRDLDAAMRRYAIVATLVAAVGTLIGSMVAARGMN